MQYSHIIESQTEEHSDGKTRHTHPQLYIYTNAHKHIHMSIFYILTNLECPLQQFNHSDPCASRDLYIFTHITHKRISTLLCCTHTWTSTAIYTSIIYSIHSIHIPYYSLRYKPNIPLEFS